MAKTIRDMALNYALDKWLPLAEGFDDCKESYKDGANDVLKEFSKLVRDCNECCAQGDRLRRLIKELKGE